MNTVWIHMSMTGRIHMTDNALTYLDERGCSYPSIAEAYREAAKSGFTHAVVSIYGYEKDRHRIPKRYR